MSNVTTSSNDNSNTNTNPETPKSNVDDLAARLQGLEGVNEDTAQFIADNWQRLLWALALVLIAVIIFSEFQSASKQKEGEASNRLTAMQQIANLNQGTIYPEEDAKKLFEQAKVLEDSFGRSSYAEFANLYEASAHFSQANYDEARKSLQSYSLDTFESIKAPVTFSSPTAKELARELAMLLFIRVSLAEGKESFEKNRDRLTALSYGSKVVTTEALVTLHRLADTDGDKAHAQTVTAAVLKARPELTGDVEGELSKLGIEVQ